MTNKELIDNTVDSLINHSKDWMIDEYSILNYKTGIALWTGCGWLLLSFYKPVELSIGLWSKFKLRKAIKKCKVKQLIKRYDEHRQI